MKYKATEAERNVLKDIYRYRDVEIDFLDSNSDKVRQGIPIGIMAAMAVCEYQTKLQAIRKSQKKWYQFWK